MKVPVTTALADMLAVHGRRGWLSPPLVPFVTPPSPVLGRATTVALAPGPPPGGGAFEPLYELLSRDLAGAMLVVAGAEDTEGAVWGQILSRAARGAGAVGAIVAGRVRDRAHLAGEGLPVWGAGEATVGAVGMAHVRAVGEPVVVAGVEVRPDDTLVVDDGGVVCLAAETAEQVLADAHSYEEAEAALLADLSTGVKLADAYDRKRRVVQAAKQRGP